VVGSDVGGDKVIPLYGKLYSKRALGFRSENVEILDTINEIMRIVGERRICALDRQWR